MGLFSKKIGPVFLKETSDTEVFIAKMEELQKKADNQTAKKIEKQINLAKYGKSGEDNIAFELKNSGMDMYILHDIYLETGELSAQIDYIVVTRKRIYIIECKNLIGNIEIDNTGAFIRTYELFGRRVKEGIYSPITQNQRHLQVIKEVRGKTKSNFISKSTFEKYFGENYRGIVVLANPKTCLNAKYANKQIKNQVIRADRLIDYIKKSNAEYDTEVRSEKEMFNLAQFYLEQNKSERSDYAKKYKEMLKEVPQEDVAAKTGVIENKQTEAEGAKNMKNEKQAGKESTEKFECEKQEETERKENTKAEIKAETDNKVKKAAEPKKDNMEIVKQLKEWRLRKSREEKIKPYYIFNDAQMEDLIAKKPHSKEELLQVFGFGNVKVEKYGEEILQIINIYEE